MSRKRRVKVHYLRQKFPKKMQKKLVLLFIAIVLAFVGLIGRVTYINAKNGERYTKIVLDQQEYNSRTIPFKRGDILDRNSTTIATSKRVYNVILDAYVMLSSEKVEEDQQAILEVKEALQRCFGVNFIFHSFKFLRLLVGNLLYHDVVSSIWFIYNNRVYVCWVYTETSLKCFFYF